MPKKKPKQTLKTTVLNWPSRHKFISFLIFLLLIYSGVWISNQIAIRQERQHYKTAEGIIKNLVADIQKVAPNNETNPYKECSYAEIKFQRRHLGCRFYYRMVYDVPSDKEAENLTNKVEGILANSHSLSLINPTRKKTVKFSAISDPTEFRDQTYGNSYALPNFDDPKCSVGYVFFVATKGKLDQKLAIDIMCYNEKDLKTNYYPIVN